MTREKIAEVQAPVAVPAAHVSDGVSDSGEQFRTIVQRNSFDDASVFLAQSVFVASTRRA